MRRAARLIVLAAVLCVCAGQGRQKAVGESCKQTKECVPGSTCVNQTCTCRSGFGRLIDSSRCLDLAQQMITNFICDGNNKCMEGIGNFSSCLVFTSKVLHCTCSEKHHSPSYTCALPCTEHQGCAKHTASTVCLQKLVNPAGNNKEPYLRYCGRQACKSANDCKDIPEAKCLVVSAGSNLTSCQAPVKSGGDNVTDIPTHLEKSFDMYLLFGLGIVGGGLVLLIVISVTVLTGQCSGDPAAKVARGRGVPVIRRQLPRFIGGMPPRRQSVLVAPPGAPRRPSVGAPKRPSVGAPRRPSVGAPRRPSVGANRRPSVGANRRPSAASGMSVSRSSISVPRASQSSISQGPSSSAVESSVYSDTSSAYMSSAASSMLAQESSMVSGAHQSFARI
ncbi:hypothetical protein ACOMHN_000880 [Nucella lapillus]